MFEQGEIKGSTKSIYSLYTHRKLPAMRLVFVGLGPAEKRSPDVVFKAVAAACRSLRAGRSRKVLVHLPSFRDGGSPIRVVRAATLGAILGNYDFRRYKKDDEESPKEIDELILVESEERLRPVLETGATVGRILGEATNLARDLVNEPANAKTPRFLGEAAKGVAERRGLEFRLLEKDDLEKKGMGAFLAVARGSQEPPVLAEMRYSGGTRKDNPVCLGLVGKGLTFDSGGLSIKPAGGMDRMKGDMAGAASVIAAMEAVAQLHPRIDVVGIVPATENLPGGAAYRPGDILRAMNGKTIEVMNTDAEGRLVLSDAMCYARELGVTHLIDVATLTGAISIALGSVCMGAFGMDRELLEKVKRAGDLAGERVWELPMFEEYEELNKSDVADLKNSGSREAQSIAAAWFLKAFSGDLPWVHLDIAGVSFVENEKPGYPKGGSGAAARTLATLAMLFDGSIDGDES